MTSSAAQRASPRWAGNPPQRGAARERLLEAAAQCIAEAGLAGASIARVAAKAGVSRPTVYRYFADREALQQATLVRAGTQLSGRMAAYVRRFSGPAAQAVEGMLFVLQEIPRDPVLREVWRSARLDPTALAGFTQPASITLTRRAIRGLAERAGWDEPRAQESAEVILRFFLSLLAAPEPRRSTAELRRFLQRRLVPALGLQETP